MKQIKQTFNWQNKRTKSRNGFLVKLLAAFGFVKPKNGRTEPSKKVSQHLAWARTPIDCVQMVNVYWEIVWTLSCKKCNSPSFHNERTHAACLSSRCEPYHTTALPNGKNYCTMHGRWMHPKFRNHNRVACNRCNSSIPKHMFRNVVTCETSISIIDGSDYVCSLYYLSKPHKIRVIVGSEGSEGANSSVDRITWRFYTDISNKTIPGYWFIFLSRNLFH